MRTRGEAFLRAVVDALVDMLRVSSGLNLPSDAVFGIVSDVVREYLSKQKSAPDIARASEASALLDRASAIIDQLEDDLASRKARLDALAADIEAKQREADHWAQLATLNQQQAAAITGEVERRIREQLRAEQDRDKWARRTAAALLWTITLLAGAAAGVTVQELWNAGYLHSWPPWRKGG